MRAWCMSNCRFLSLFSSLRSHYPVIICSQRRFIYSFMHPFSYSLNPEVLLAAANEVGAPLKSHDVKLGEKDSHKSWRLPNTLGLRFSKVREDASHRSIGWMRLCRWRQPGPHVIHVPQSSKSVGSICCEFVESCTTNPKQIHRKSN